MDFGKVSSNYRGSNELSPVVGIQEDELEYNDNPAELINDSAYINV
jgi:hypothetical protein